MRVDDRVHHRRMGMGTVLKTGLASARVKVKFDDGDIKVLAESRLRVMASNTAPDEDAPAQPTAATRDRKIPYARLEEVKAHFETKYPDASEVKALWYNGRPYVEVWEADGGAKIFMVRD